MRAQPFLSSAGTHLTLKQTDSSALLTETGRNRVLHVCNDSHPGSKEQSHTHSFCTRTFEIK